MMGEGTFSCPKGQYVYYVQTQASEDDQRSAKEALKPIIDHIIALTEDTASSEASAGTQPLLQVTYRQLVPSSSVEPTSSNLSAIPFPPPSTTSNRPVTSISSLTDASVHLAEKVYYDILASRVTQREGRGDTHADKVQWIQQTLQRQRLERKRRKRRDPAEYQGRGGRGTDDGVTRPVEDEQQANEKEEPIKVIGFFESVSDHDGNDDDEDDEGA